MVPRYASSPVEKAKAPHRLDTAALAMNGGPINFKTLFCHTIRTSGTKLKMDFGGLPIFQNWSLNKGKIIVHFLDNLGFNKLVLALIRYSTAVDAPIGFRCL